MSTIRFELNHALPLQNVWDRWHWRTQRRFTKRLAKELWVLYLRDVGVPRFEAWATVRISVMRRSEWRGIAPDKDAVLVKSLLDVLQPASKRHPYGLGFIADDSREVIRDLIVSVEKGAAKTIVEIEDLSDHRPVFCPTVESEDKAEGRTDGC